MVVKNSKDSLSYEYRKMFSDRKAWEYFRHLEQELTYLKKEAMIEIYGKKYFVPRQITAYGDPGITYKFSGTIMFAKPWTPLLKEIKQMVELTCKVQFNYVLVNRYKDGTNCIGAHKDDEKDLDRNAGSRAGQGERG